MGVAPPTRSPNQRLSPPALVTASAVPAIALVVPAGAAGLRSRPAFATLAFLAIASGDSPAGRLTASRRNATSTSRIDTSALDQHERASVGTRPDGNDALAAVT